MKFVHILFATMFVALFANCNRNPVLVHLQYNSAPDSLHLRIVLQDGNTYEGNASKFGEKPTLLLDMAEHFPDRPNSYEYTLVVEGLDDRSCVISEGQLVSTYNPTSAWGQHEYLALIELPIPKCK